MTFSVKRILFFLIFLLSVSLVFAGGEKEVPNIPPVTTGIQYISPNGDDIQEEASLEFTVSLYLKAKEGYVPEYGLEIIDSSGAIVASQSQSEGKKLNFFAKLASLFMGWDKFELTREITWDGMDPDGTLVSDGVYEVKLWVKDSDGIRSDIAIDDFVVDTTPPEVSVAGGEGMLFAPNGDGMLEVFPVILSGGTEEDLWEASLLDSAGTVVKSMKWESGAPESFDWDGTGDDGVQVADGIYSFKIGTTDKAGNSFESVFPGIILDSRASMIHHEITDPIFSPNGDGKKDVCIIDLEYDETEDVELWSYSLSSNNSIFATFQGDGPPPEQIILDGKDENGDPLSQGVYKFSYSLTYVNDWRPVIEDVIEIDSIPPRIGVYTSSKIFSPNQDGLNDKTNISFKSSEEVVWTGAILNMDGDTVLETSSKQTTSLIVWDGTNLSGETLPDGEYLVLAKFTDNGGNEVYSEPVTLKVDNRPVSISLSAGEGFSPNNDGKNDTMKIKIDAALYGEVVRWEANCVNENGEDVRTFTGTGELPKFIMWNGKTTLLDKADEPVPAAEGLYYTNILVEYEKGDITAAETGRFFLDMTPPEIQFMVTADPFIKTDEGVEGNVFMSVQVRNESPISDWNLDILDDNGNILRAYSGVGDPSGDVAWNSRRDSAGLLDESMASYTIRLSVTDAGGNSSLIREDLPLDILVVRRDGKLYLMVPNIIFGAYKHTLDSAGPSREIQNYESIGRVVEIYDRYPDFNLELEAHALNIYLDGPREDAEEAILLPLTEKRAASVKDALIDLGMDELHIRSHAYGGQYPIADVTDRTVWWKNRRVEFIMTDR
ncbi:MAG: gliding motility-associated C-terminal domain-containing protein [Spirochaetales bacterium]|nr:gliding motility-associated C-terminal domain-containing protein [Spirochaetales bacterium]